ncbi:MAG: hypothetical protein QXU34_08480, partial [Ignisphaera sp.]
MKFIALDIGKTKSIAMMFDENLDILCSVSSGPADITLEENIVKTNIRDAIDTCLRRTTTSIEDVDLIVFSWA